MERFVPSAVTCVCLAALMACGGGWTTADDDDTGPDFGAALVGIGVSPINPTVTLGEPIQFVATGFYDDQTTRNITDTVDWYSTETSVIDVSSGLDSEGRGTTVGPGQSMVGCQMFDFGSNEVRVTVTEAAITSLQVVPPAVQLHGGETVQLEAAAEFSDGSHGNVTGSVRWITSNPGVVTVDVNGVATAGTSLGSAEVQVIYETGGGGEYEGTPGQVEVLDGSVVIDEADVRVLGVNAVETGGTVTYTVEIKNSGGSPASSFWIDAWLNRTAAPPPPPTSGDAYQFVSLLDSGESAQITIEMADASPGSFQSWVMVDSFNSVIEGSVGENNNIWGPEPVTVSGSGGPIGPDLSITYLQAFVQESQEQVLYIVDVTNTGDQAATGFTVSVYADPAFPPVAPEQGDESAYVDVLPAGETAYLDVAVRAIPSGYWQSYVLADSAAQIDEPNEDNNLSAFQVVP